MSKPGDLDVPRRAYPGWPQFSDAEVEAAVRVLRSGRVNYWTGGEGRAFESELAAFHGAAHALASSNGTVALEAALAGLGVGPGDEVVVPSRTFIASASAVVARGAAPVMADVGRDSGNLTAETLAAAITPKTRAVVAVHLAGWPCEMDAITEVARAHDLAVVEDYAQALGATFRGQAVGTWGDVGALSFCQDKILTTAGEGGAVVTDDTELYERMWAYKDHGKSYEAVYRRTHPPGFRWLHESFGTNGRMTEIQAAVGRVALARLPQDLAARAHHAELLNGYLLAQPALRTPLAPEHARHAWYKLYTYVRPEALKSGWSRDRIQLALEARGVPVRQGSCSEIYLERAFEGTGWRPTERLPVAQELGDTSLMFQVHPPLSDDDMHAMGEAVADVLGQATR